MMALEDSKPRITRILPAVPAETHPAHPAHPVWPSVLNVRPRYSTWLQGREPLQVWDDRVVVAGRTYPLDDTFGARVTPDPRAPLMADPPIGLALLASSGHWDYYGLERETDLWPTVFAIHRACRERNIEPIGLTDEGADAPLWGALAPAEPLAPGEPLASSQPVRSPVVTRPMWGDQEAGWTARSTGDFALADAQPLARASVGPTELSASEAVLAAIAHLSLLFLPALLPAAIWLSLRFAAPHVAYQARRAALFQCGAGALMLGLLGYSFVAALGQGFSVAARVGMIGFFVTMAAGAGCALYGAISVLRGQRFS